jgi:hypothetical protein
MSEDLRGISDKVARALEKYATCNYILDEIMSLLAEDTEGNCSGCTCVSNEDMEWVNRNYKKYNEME